MKKSARFMALLVVSILVMGKELYGTVKTTPVITGLSRPLLITSPPGDLNRMFIVEQGGRIRIFRDGAVSSTFLDISAKVSCCGERGLLGLAFHPKFPDNGRFYVNYTDRSGTTVIAEYRAVANPDIADDTTERVLMTQMQPYENHNGGNMAFSPIDGYLYIGFGDGGGAGDPMNNAQSDTTWLGKMLRIDVDGRDGGRQYGIPPDNPFLGRGGKMSEVWAFGLRNPWRFHFDSRTGDLFIADVGQDRAEEINLQPATSAGGENYGWRLMEGANCYNPSQNCVGTRILTLPVYEYSHSENRCSVIGGPVVHNPELPELDGSYLFADYCTAEIFALTRVAGGRVDVKNVSKEISYGGGKRIRNPSAIGTDGLGRVYLCDMYDGTVFRFDSDSKTIARTVPIVLDASGRGDARYLTSMSVANTGSTPVSVTYTYTAAAQLGASGSGSASEALAVGKQIPVTDILERLRVLGVPIPREGNQGGTLQVAATGSSVANAVKVTARTTAPSGPGRAGLAYGAPQNSQMFTSSALVFGLRESEAERSNLAVFNPSPLVITLDVTVISGVRGESKIWPESLILQPGEWRQLEGVLKWAGFASGTARIDLIGGKGYFSAYGIVNDNGTNDGSFLIPVLAVRPKEAVTVPAVVETKAYDTELILANPSDEDVVATIEYRESLGGYTGNVVRMEEPVEASSQNLLAGIIDRLRKAGGAVGEKGSNLAGSLRITFRNSEGLRVAGLAGALVRTVGGTAGQYGVFVQGVSVSEGFYGTATIPGLLQDETNRSNVAVVHMGDTTTALSVHLDVVDGSTGAVAGTFGPFGLSAGEWKQVDGILQKFSVKQGYVRVRAEGGARFVAYGVINDGATPGQGTSDGSAYLGE